MESAHKGHKKISFELSIISAMNDIEFVNFLDARVLVLNRIVDVARGDAGGAQHAETGLQDCHNLLRSILDLRVVIQQYEEAHEEACNAGLAADVDRIHRAQHALQVRRLALEESARNVARLLASWLARYGNPVNPEGCTGREQALFGITFERGDTCVRLFIDRYGMNFRECYPVRD